MSGYRSSVINGVDRLGWQHFFVMVFSYRYECTSKQNRGRLNRLMDRITPSGLTINKDVSGCKCILYVSTRLFAVTFTGKLETANRFIIYCTTCFSDGFKFKDSSIVGPCSVTFNRKFTEIVFLFLCKTFEECGE